MKKETRLWVDGTFGGPDEAMELLAFHLRCLGATEAEVVVFAADGAPWVWERLDWVERRVGLAAGRAVRVLDWCHAVHNLSLALEALRLPEDERQRQYAQLRHCLREGWWGLVVDELETLGAAAGSPKDLEQPLAYLTKHGEAGHLDYKRLRRRGLPQGSGAIESAIRRGINLRLKGPGLVWQEGDAQGALTLRAAAGSQRWGGTPGRVREGMGRGRLVRGAWRAPA